MNIANRLTIFRIVLGLIVVIILSLPYSQAGITIPSLFINELLVINLKYIIAGFLFIAASITDLFDGKIARKRGEITEFGRISDDLADKLLADTVLIILACTGFINSILVVVIVGRDLFVSSIKTIALTHGKLPKTIILDKIKSYILTISLGLTLFYNLPFELVNLKVSDYLLVISVVLGIISAFQYYHLYKKIIYQSMKCDIIEKVDI